MVSDEVEARAFAFIDRYLFLSLTDPRLRLDFTWESTSLVGAILRPYHGIEELDSGGQELLRDASVPLE